MKIEILKDARAAIAEARHQINEFEAQINNIEIDSKPGSALQAGKEAKLALADLTKGPVRTMKLMTDAAIQSLSRMANQATRKSPEGEE